MMARLALLLALLGEVARGEPSTQPVPEQARQLAERGRAYHDAGDYADAIAAFQAAYVIAPSPGLLFNLAQAYRLAGDCNHAAWMYRRYLATNPVGQRRALAQTHLWAVETCDDRPSLSGSPARAEEATVPALAVDTREIEPAGRKLKTTGIYLGIGGTIALAGAAWFAFDAHDASNVVTDAYRKGGKWSDIASTEARGERSSELAAILGIGGGTAAVAGAVCYLLGIRAERLQHVVVQPSTHGGTISASWRF
jgi:tetratricopeptide (TPR) repeat protein